MIKNRGTAINPEGRFEQHIREVYDDGWDLPEEESVSPLQTLIYPEKAKTVISRNESPDIGFNQSINPYRGCENGCIYCYARPSHAYMNLSPGLDFETKIFYKKDAAKILENEINKINYECEPIMLGANTDPYQPIESKLKVTRSLLEVLNAYHHPVAIITKSRMIERDLDILSDMAQRNLVKAAVSITTLSNDLKHIMEPRTSSPKGRLHAVEALSKLGIPVRVMAAPMIPIINDNEMEAILRSAKDAGAMHASYVLLRLPYEVKNLFKEWLSTHFPHRAEHVMSIIRQLRGGKEYDATYGMRMRGEGEFAKLLETRFKLACKRYGLNLKPLPGFNMTLFKKKSSSQEQLNLF